MMTMLTIFFFNDTATTEIYTLSLHDALPIWEQDDQYRFTSSSGSGPEWLIKGRNESIGKRRWDIKYDNMSEKDRSEEHTSELQSQSNLVCRLLLEKKKINASNHHVYSATLTP